MRKVLLSLTAILLLLVLVSCPEGVIPTSALDISLSMSEDSEIKLEQFEKLNYTIKEVESGKEITQELSTIEDIVIPVNAAGEYVISVTGVMEDDNYIYTCSGSETITIAENQTAKVVIILKTTKVGKGDTISVSFINKIESSSEYDLAIAKISYVVSAGDKEVAKGELKTSESNSINLSASEVVGDLKYSLTAYNASGDIVGEGNGVLKIEAGVKEYSVSILEKEGEGTIIFDLKKDSRYNFPEIKVGDKIVEIGIGPYGNTGTGSIALKNGVYDIYEDGVIKESVRVVQGKEKTISYDYRKWVDFSFSVDVNQENAKGLNLELDHYNYTVTDSSGFTYKGTHEKNVTGVGFLEDDYDYLFEAVNSDGVVFAEAKGKVFLSEYEGPVKVVMKEKAGDGKLLVNCIKNANADFPVITIDENEYTFEKISATEGKATITLENGIYTVSCGGEEEIIRIAVNQTNILDFDFSSTAIPVVVIDNIPRYDGLDMEIAKLSYRFEKDGEVIENLDATIDELRALMFKKSDKEVWDYEVKAYNKAGAQIGESAGRYLFGYQTESFKIKLEETIGEGSIRIDVIRPLNTVFPIITIEDETISEDCFTSNIYKDGINIYSYTTNKKSGEYVISIGNTVKTVRVVNGIEIVLSADYSTGIDVDIKNEVSASGNYGIASNQDGSNSFYITCDEVKIDDDSNISVKWILNNSELGSTSKTITFNENELKSGTNVLYAYIYEDNKLLDIASKLFTIN